MDIYQCSCAGVRTENIEANSHVHALNLFLLTVPVGVRVAGTVVSVSGPVMNRHNGTRVTFDAASGERI